MGSRVYGTIVVLLWATSMTWLMYAKILPSLHQGERPASVPRSATPPVGWKIELGGSPCGESVSQAVDGVAGVVELHSRVTLEYVPLDEVAPRWMLGLVKDVGDIDLDIRSKTTLDSFGNLATMMSRIMLNGAPSVVRVDGHVAEGKLKLKIKSGQLTKVSEYPWRDGSLLGELSPESRMTALHVGQTWRSDVYSPFGSPHDPVEMVEAFVAAEEQILHDESLVLVRRVEYRSLSGAGVSAKNRLRTVVWVADDGRVLRQDVHFLNTQLRFQRMTDAQSASLAEERLELGRYAATEAPPVRP